MQWFAITLAMLLFTAVPAAAEMAITNLTRVNTDIVEKQGWTVRKQSGRMTLMCTGCREFTATDVLLERSSDGTEGRIRSGRTTAKMMMDVCRQNAKSRGSQCFDITPIKLKGAVGFLNDVSLGPMGFAATYVLWQDGRRLTIRNVAPSRRAAKQNGAVMLRAIGAQIVR